MTKIKSRFLYILVINFVLVSIIHTEPPSFIVEDAPRTHKRSKSSLKEDLGESLKQSLHACTSYNKEAGSVQKKLSKLQTGLLNATENIIEQAPPIKNASRKTIAETIQLINSVSSTMKAQTKLLSSLQKKIDGCNCLKKQS